MKNKYDKDRIKNSLNIEQIYDLVSELGGEPLPIKGDTLVSRTICHNPAGQGSYKLYYYDNTKLFKCYTDCGDYFDIFELIRKQKTISTKTNWTLRMAITFVVSYFGVSEENDPILENLDKLFDWKIFDNYDAIRENTHRNQIIDLEIFDDSILKYLLTPTIPSWEKEGIKKNIIKKNNILYDPINNGIIIPHYDKDGRLVGIRERTLIKEIDEEFGKYRPAKLNGKMYNHPLSFNLYNLNNSKSQIKKLKKAIVFEGEKSTMQYQSIFGEDNDISVACCGSSLTFYQIGLLLKLEVNEIIIGFDKQFQKIGDEEFKRWTKKLVDINNKYKNYVQISFLFDKWNLLNYKSSPIDEGRDKFIELFDNRIFL